jgi:hypothetical protein
MNTNLVKRAWVAVTLGWLENSKLTQEIMDIDGMSSPKVRHFLNHVTAFPECRYLEIGCWKGSTLISALYGNPAHHWAVDNWSQFDGPRDQLVANFKKFIGSDPNLIDRDAFSLDPVAAGITGVNVYFYDGDHSDVSHRKAITHYLPSMANEFILIVDDWSVESRQIETRDAIAETGLKILAEHTLPGVNNSRKLWWCGLWVAVLQK